MMPDLVLLHGWALTRRVWEPVIPALSEAFRVHNLALPGYEGSFHYRESDTGRALLDRWADEVAAAAPAGAVWMGWSLGAMVVLNAVLRAAAGVTAAVLVAATPRFVRRGDWEAGMDPEVLDSFRNGIRRDRQGTLKRFAMLQAGGPEQPKALARALAGCLADGEAGRGVLEAGLNVLDEVDLRPGLEAVDVPVLVVHGAEDAVVPPAAGAWVADRVARGRLVTLDAGHAPFVTRPREFAEAVLAWT